MDIVLNKQVKKSLGIFYTKSDPIVQYMTAKLNICENDKILEPCAGDGVFIDIILNNIGNCSIDALEIDPNAIKVLQDKYSHRFNINIRQTDTLLDSQLDIFSTHGYYDKIIGNPPYGGFQSIEKRKILKLKYKCYSRETYTLFIKRCIQLMKDNGRLVFIIPDTFLALHLHKKIRKYILENTEIEELLLIPSKFFPNVNFGYANLCIMTLVKKIPSIDHNIKITSIQSCVDELYNIDHNSNNILLNQYSVLNSVDSAFYLNSTNSIRHLFSNTDYLSLGDIADCVTGFYTGNNKMFIHSELQDRNLLYNKIYNRELINGVPVPFKYIEYLKGGATIIKKADVYIQWSISDIAIYKKNKKARFQNSQFYFKQGIGIPMVRGKEAQAFLLNQRLFDQSIVGIFPKDDKFLFFILAFLNSKASRYLLKVINHTVNNSANYLKKLPIIYTESSLVEAQNIIENYINHHNSLEDTLNLINDLFTQLYKELLQ